MRKLAFLLAGYGLAGALVAGASKVPDSGAQSADGEAVTGCRVTDGDTIRCGTERIRLLGIDAPELPGHCSGNRVCVAGDPHASATSLALAMIGSLHIHRVGKDRFGRTLAMVAGARGDLSCWQLSRGQAVYVSKWDNGLRIARRCCAATQRPLAIPGGRAQSTPSNRKDSSCV